MRSVPCRATSGRVLGAISLPLLLSVAGAAAAAAQTLEVSGTLQLADGSPAKGALVELIPFPGSYLRRLHELRGDALPEPVDRTESDDDGGYRLTAPGPGTWRLMIQPQVTDGVTVAGVTVAGARRDLLPLAESVELPAITLPERRTLTVEVLASGAPVADALVLAGLVQASLRDPAHGRFSPVVNRPAARTGNDGIARFSVPEGAVRVRVVAPGHHLGGEDSSSRRVRVTLRPGPSRKIVVVDAGGRPMSGAIVRVGDSLIPITTTDEAGRAVVGTVPGQSVSYQAETLDGYYGSSGTDYPPVSETGDDPVIRIIVEPPERVQGRLVDAETGSAVTGALVWSPWRPSDQVLSDRSGSFSLATWTSSRGLSLEVMASGYVPAQLQLSPAQLRLGEEQTLALAPAQLLVGRVIDETGQAIGGALVKAEARDRRAIASARRGDLVATTGVDGAFRLGGMLSEVGYSLEVSAEGFAPSRLEVAPGDSQPLEVVLRRGVLVWGRVVDNDDRPLAGATVTLRPLPEQGRDRVWPPPGEAKGATTDNGGAYRVESLPPGRYDLEASLSGFAPSELSGLEVAATADELDLGAVVLERGAVLAGIVVDNRRQPLAGANVELYRQPSSSDHRRPLEPLTKTSAVDGSFAFDSIRSGEQVSLRVSHQGLATSDVHGVRAPTGQPIEILLEAGATLTGRVVDLRGSGLAGANVQLALDHRFATAALGLPQQRDLRTTSEDEGAYSIPRVPTGTWRAWAAGPGGEVGEASGIETTSGEVHRLDIVVRPQVTLSGRVTGPGGEPVPGAEVSFERRSGDNLSSSSVGVTDAAGLYHGEIYDREERGPAEVVASHPDYRQVRRSVELGPGENVVDLTLERGWEIRGRVFDSKGSPLAGAQVSHRPLRPSPFYVREPGLVVTDASGRFTILGLDDGEYQLSATKDRYADTALETPALINGGSVDGVELVLDRGGVLSGRVIGLPPERLTEVRVAAVRRGFHEPVQSPPEALVDTEGTFRFDALGAGDWQVVASVMDDGRTVARSVRIEEEGTESYVELEFESGYTLTGWVTREGEPLAGAAISLHSELGQHRRAQTDHRGAFALEALSAGAYSLRIESATGSSHTRQIELLGDDEILIDLPQQAIATGIVVDDLGAPLGGARISAVTRASESGMMSTGGHARSGGDGNFQIDLEAGPWELLAQLDGYVDTPLAVDVVGGERLSGLRLAMSRAELVTLLVRRADGRPVDWVAVARADASTARTADMALVGVDGRAVLDFLPPGTWQVWVYSKASLPAQITVDVPGEPVAVLLQPGGRVDLTVVDLVGAGSVARVKVFDPAGAAYRHPMSQGDLLGVVQDGRGSLSPLSPGLWTVVVEANDGRSWSRAVEIVAGQTVSLVIE